MVNSKFWFKPDPGPAVFKQWDKWHSEEPPKDGSHFAARINKTNLVKDAFWDGTQFCSGLVPVTIHQWLSYKEWGDVKECLWKSGPT